VINISTNNEITISELCNKIIKISGKKIVIKSENNRVRPVNSEVDRLMGDNRKILKLTDWQPAVNLDNGLKKTYRWLSKKENLQKYKTNIYNL
jgi:nucleoside-diphosphate-sugar epimerase